MQVRVTLDEGTGDRCWERVWLLYSKYHAPGIHEVLPDKKPHLLHVIFHKMGESFAIYERRCHIHHEISCAYCSIRGSLWLWVTLSGE